MSKPNPYADMEPNMPACLAMATLFTLYFNVVQEWAFMLAWVAAVGCTITLDLVSTFFFVFVVTVIYGAPDNY